MKKLTEPCSGNKINYRISPARTAGALVVFAFLSATWGCQKNDLSSMATQDQAGQTLPEWRLPAVNEFMEHNLVSDADEYTPVFMDAQLVNAWGLAFNDEGEAWVSATESGVSTIYDPEGVTLDPPVAIPFGADPMGGNPTGVIYNPTSGFIIPSSGETSEFIFATENGTIAAWSSGSTAVTVADRSTFNSVYKGITFAKSGGSSYIYATDFKNAKVDVFNDHFEYQTGFAFTDPEIPAGFAPFNIRALGGMLYVTYAKQLAPDNEDDEAGPGNGYVDIYNTDGSFVQRFASTGSLNSPWGIEEVNGSTTNILVGNFGDGMISIFDTAGSFQGYLKTGGVPIVIEGLWSLVFPRTNVPSEQSKRLYFTSGPDEESHGVYGYIAPN